MPNDARSPPLRGLVVVALMDFQPRHKAWGWLRLAQGASAFRDVPGLRFAKVMGSGHGGGFTLRPSSTHQGLITLLDDAATATAFLSSPQLQDLQQRSRSFWCSMLSVESARGEWDGQSWAPLPASPTSASQDTGRALAVITRASIRPAKAMTFWRHAPASQASLQHAQGCQIAMGLGEAPLLRQCTFSLWQDTTTMESYARSGAHQQAAAAAYREGYFTESMFVRLRPLEQHGHWPSMQEAAA